MQAKCADDGPLMFSGDKLTVDVHDLVRITEHVLQSTHAYTAKGPPDVWYVLMHSFLLLQHRLHGTYNVAVFAFMLLSPSCA